MPDATFTLRTARPDDATALSALMRATFVASNGHCSTPANVAAFLDTVYTPARQRAEIENPDIRTVLVQHDGTLQGFAQLRFAAAAPACVTLARPFELGRIYLAAALQGRGAAAALLRNIDTAARARGSDGLWLNVWQEQPRAIAFYAKHGFSIVGTSIFQVGDDPKEDWVMERAFAGLAESGE